MFFLQLLHPTNSLHRLQLLPPTNIRRQLLSMPQRIQISNSKRINILLKMSHTISIMFNRIINLLLLTSQCLHSLQLPRTNRQLLLLRNIRTQYPNLRRQPLDSKWTSLSLSVPTLWSVPNSLHLHRPSRPLLTCHQNIRKHATTPLLLPFL